MANEDEVYAGAETGLMRPVMMRPAVLRIPTPAAMERKVCRPACSQCWPKVKDEQNRPRWIENGVAEAAHMEYPDNPGGAESDVFVSLVPTRLLAGTDGDEWGCPGRRVADQKR